MESRKPGLKDYYAVLGVAPEATPKEIKKAYRALAHKYHPDRAQLLEDVLAGAERMIEINEAYSTLSDEKRKADYDLERSGKKPAPAAPPPPEPEPLVTTTPSKFHTVPVNPDVGLTVGRDFLEKLRISISEKGASANLKEQEEKNWHWSFLGKTWGGNYWVSLRLCAMLNPATAREVLTQADALIGKRRSGWKSNVFVFVLAFQSLNEGETVLKLCRAYCNREENSTGRNLVNVVVMDLNRRRSVLCGKRGADSNVGAILSALAAS